MLFLPAAITNGHLLSAQRPLAASQSFRAGRRCAQVSAAEQSGNARSMYSLALLIHSRRRAPCPLRSSHPPDRSREITLKWKKQRPGVGGGEVEGVAFASVSCEALLFHLIPTFLLEKSRAAICAHVCVCVSLDITREL